MLVMIEVTVTVEGAMVMVVGTSWFEVTVMVCGIVAVNVTGTSEVVVCTTVLRRVDTSVMVRVETTVGLEHTTQIVSVVVVVVVIGMVSVVR